MVGVAKVNATLPIGTPLAGYNHGARRVPYWPLPQPGEYTTFMTPSKGIIDPIWARALVIDDGKGHRVCFVSLDACGADGSMGELAFDIAKAKGFTVPQENCVISGSHTHSGPGAVTPELLWELAPATDLLVPVLQKQMATYIADALVAAQANMKPAKLNIGMGQLWGVTANRRAGTSPYVTRNSIDPNLGVIRIDDLNGNPIATVWNFAIHGTCYGADNMYFCTDIMGRVNTLIEQTVGGVSLFVNADAGDVAPTGETCANAPYFAGAPKIASAVQQVRNAIVPSGDILIQSYSQIFPFGPTNMNLTLERIANCTHGGPLDICSICRVLKCDLNLHLGDAWIETEPRFSAFRFTVNGNVHNLLVTIPGEAIVELGTWIRNATRSLGFTNVLLYGYSNNHLSYFTTPREYEAGGYESVMTFWGIDSAYKIRDCTVAVATRVRP
jgi:neutral ceramidase